MKKIKFETGLLILYVLLQLAALFFGFRLDTAFFLFAYPAIYFVAIIYASVQTSKAVTRNNSLKPLASTLISFFVANLILFLIYIPTLIYNPDVNPTFTWKLLADGETQDPIILQAYIPPIFFCIAFVMLVLTALVTKFISGYIVARKSGVKRQ